MHEAPIIVRGRVTEVLKPGLYRIELPNGKLTLGHLSKSLKQAQTELEHDEEVELELTPFDFDAARIARVLAG